MTNAPTALSIVLSLFGATIVVSLSVACYQYFYERQRIYLLSTLFWVSILVSSVVNALVADKESYLYLLSMIATFCNQFILAAVICQVGGVKLQTRTYTLIFSGVLLISYIAKAFGLSFEWHVLLAIGGAVVPVPHAVYLALKNRVRKLTTAQTLFFVFCILISAHYLDYSFFKGNNDLFALGLTIAFFLLHVISSLLPMVVNEHHLYLRNLSLENEIHERLLEIRDKDRRLWELNKLEALGRFAGSLAHELNTPLASISLAVSSIQTACLNTPPDTTEIQSRLDIIKAVVRQIAKMTSALRAASGDQIGRVLTRIDLKKILLDYETSIRAHCAENNIQLSFQVVQTCNVLGDTEELKQLLRLMIYHIAGEVITTQNPWIDIALETMGIHCILAVSYSSYHEPHSGSDSPSPWAAETSKGYLGLDLVVIKSIVDKLGGSISFDQGTNSREIRIEIPCSEESTSDQ